MLIAGDRVPQRYVEGYQQAPPIEIQLVRQQEADAFWADKIAEIMRDQFGIKPKVNTYSYRTPYPPAYDLIPLPNWYKVPDFTKFSGKMIHQRWNTSIASLFNVERQLAEMN
jgi:hypothetical protein